MRHETILSLRGYRGFAMLIAIGALLSIGRGTAAGQDPQAAPIPPDAKVTKDDVRGLEALYYNFGKVRPVGTAGIDSRDIAHDFTKERAPDAVVPLDGSNIDFPPGPEGVIKPEGISLGEFLKSDDGVTEGALATKMSSRNVFVFKGFIEVPKEGTFVFRVPADDGVELTIGGVSVLSHFHGGWWGPRHEWYLGKAEFAEPGIYPVEVLFWDRAQEAGIEVYSDVNPAGEARDVGGGSLTLLPFLSGPAAN